MKGMWKFSILPIVFYLGIAPLEGQVSVQIGDVATDAYNSNIVVPVILDNPGDLAVAGIQFDVTVIPSMVALFNVTPVGGAAAFTADFNALNDSTTRVLLYNGAGTAPLPAGSDTVLTLHYDGSTVASAVLDLVISGLVVSDSSGNLLTATGINGGIQIGYVVTLSLTSDSADVNETALLQVNMDNGGLVGGVQFDLYDTPDYLSLDSVWTTDRTTGFAVDTASVGTGVRILLYEPTGNNIAPGSGAILNIRFRVHSNAFAWDVAVNFDGVVVTDDIGGIYWIAGLDSGTVTVFPGYLEEPHNLEAISGLDGQVPLNWEAPYGPIPPEFSEDFEAGVLPEGWTMTTNSAVGWFITQDGSSTYWSIPSHTWYACSNDDAADDDGSVDYLITPPLNVGNVSTITLNFASYFTGEYGQTAHLEVSTDGVNFTEVTSLEPAFEWVIETVDLSAYAGNTSLYVAFHSNDNGFWASGWAVDDIQITFATTRVSRTVHFRPTPLGQWLITADKAEVIEQYPGGIPYELKVDLSEPVTTPARDVSRDLTGFNIYRASDTQPEFQLLDAVGANVTSYVDETVTNSITYYYYVTSVYTPGGESAPSNQVAATPVEWVELSISDGGALSGQTDTLEISIHNESDITLFYFEISDVPEVFSGETILPTDRTANWTLDVVELPSGIMVVSGIGVGAVLSPGDGPVCRVVVRAYSDEEVEATVDFASANITDVNDNSMQWTSTPASFLVTIETQTLVLASGVASPGAVVSLPLLLTNTQNVHGIQVFITDQPDYLTGLTINPSTYIDFSEWTIDGNNVGNEYRILLYDNSLSNPIPPGAGHIADVYFTVSANAPLDTEIDLELTNVVISDVNNIPMHAETMPVQVFVGTPQALFSFEEVGGTQPGGVGNFVLNLQNLVPVYVLELMISDLPENLTLTNVTPTGRFGSGTIDSNTGETEDGQAYILAYDLANGIAPGAGPILSVDVTADQVMDASQVLMILSSTSAAGSDLTVIPSMAAGYGLFDIYLSIDEAEVLPESFALHQNYPNPFNPVTYIGYDLKEDAKVNLTIYDLTGREVKTLVNHYQTAGRKGILWDGKDNRQRPVSAGVYLYRLQAGDFTATRKMVLMK
jgi:hypothetical protein